MKNFSSWKLEKQLYTLGWLLLPVAVLFYLFVTQIPFFRHLPCLFYQATGFLCPGCGATRSLYLLLHGKWLLSFFYYPALPYCAILYFWFMFSHSVDFLSHGQISIGLSFRKIYVYLALALVIGNFLFKNLLILLS